MALRGNRAASYLGIESGGTRTTALLSPGGGQPCLRAEFGPANLRLLNDAALARHFTAINALCLKARAPLAGLAIGMAGARTESGPASHATRPTIWKPRWQRPAPAAAPNRRRKFLS